MASFALMTGLLLNFLKNGLLKIGFILMISGGEEN